MRNWSPMFFGSVPWIFCILPKIRKGAFSTGRADRFFYLIGRGGTTAQNGGGGDDPNPSWWDKFLDWLFPKRKKENFEVGPVVIMDDDGGSPIPWLGPIGAGSIPNGPLHDASKNFHRLSSNLPMTIVQGALRKFKSTLNKNNDDAESHFVIYKITFDGEVYKFGKADYERITKESGYPTRLHQQLRTLRKDNPNVSIQAEIVEDLGITTTEFAKKIENDYLQRYWDIYKIVPEGNRKSFKPK